MGCSKMGRSPMQGKHFQCWLIMVFIFRQQGCGPHGRVLCTWHIAIAWCIVTPWIRARSESFSHWLVGFFRLRKHVSSNLPHCLSVWRTKYNNHEEVANKESYTRIGWSQHRKSGSWNSNDRLGNWRFHCRYVLPTYMMVLVTSCEHMK